MSGSEAARAGIMRPLGGGNLAVPSAAPSAIRRARMLEARRELREPTPRQVITREAGKLGRQASGYDLSGLAGR